MDPNNNLHVLIECSNGDARNILFNVALHAARSRQSVLYIASSPIDRLPAGLARPGHGLDINFMYVPTAAELSLRLATLHTTWPPPPSAAAGCGAAAGSLICVESLHQFCPNGRGGGGGGGGRSCAEPVLNALSLALVSLHAFAAGREPATRTCCSVAASRTWPAMQPDVLQTVRRLYYWSHNCWEMAATNGGGGGAKAAETEMGDRVVRYLWPEQMQ